MTEPALIASCWTSAGDTAPLRASELSPYDAQTRVREVSASGWEGLGFVLDDLRAQRCPLLVIGLLVHALQRSRHIGVIVVCRAPTGRR